jgi:hypothetical protein
LVESGQLRLPPKPPLGYRRRRKPDDPDQRQLELPLDPAPKVISAINGKLVT